MKYWNLIKYIVKLFIFNPAQLFVELKKDLKKDFSSSKYKSQNKSVLIFGLPKSGTTLVEEILEHLPYVRLNRSPVRFYVQPNLKNPHSLNDKSFKFFSKKKYSFIKTHTFFNDKHIDLVRKYNVKVIFCFRDIRDVMISRYYHVISDKKHWQYKEIANLPQKEGFLKSLTSLKNYPFETRENPIEEYYNWVFNWLSFKDINNFTVLWYEDYVKDPITYINKILSDLDFKEFEAINIESKLNLLREKNKELKLNSKLLKLGKNVSTYREGRPGIWKDFLDEETYNKFVSCLPGPIKNITRN